MGNIPTDPTERGISAGGRLADVERFTKHPTARFIVLGIIWLNLGRLSSDSFFLSMTILAFGFAQFRSSLSPRLGIKRYLGFVVYLVVMAIGLMGIFSTFEQTDIDGLTMITVDPKQRMLSQVFAYVGIKYIPLAGVWLSMLLAGVLDWILLTSPGEADVPPLVKTAVDKRKSVQAMQKGKKKK